MDLLASIQKRAVFIEQQKAANLQFQMQKVIQAQLLSESDHRLVSPGVIRGIVFEMTYVLFRHRAWHSAPLLAELVIDFLNSEYLLPHHVCTQIVEACLDLVHRYAVVETAWDAETFDQEFLEHLFICSLVAEDDYALTTDIGFGRNVIELLHSAMRLDQGSANEDVFQFAPELATRLHAIMQKLLDEAAGAPAVLDLLKLKNHLQRDPYLRKSSLDRPYLEKLGAFLQSCGARECKHNASAESMQATPAQQDITLLQRNGLIFEEPQPRGKASLYRLTHAALTLSSKTFAAAYLSEHPLPSLDLKALPAPYQVALVQQAAEKDPIETQRVLLGQAGFLSPEALRLLIEASKKRMEDESLLELFESLLHNRSHAWIRAEICHALPLSTAVQSSQSMLESLAEKDPSPMVRSAARAALKRSARESTRSSSL